MSEKSRLTTAKRRSKRRSGERYWPNPKIPEVEDFGNFCREWGVPDTAAAEFQSFIQELVREASSRLSDIRKNKTIGSARSDLAKVLKSLGTAHRHLAHMQGTSRALFDIPPRSGNFSNVTAVALSELYDVRFLSRVTGNSPWELRDDRHFGSSRRIWAHQVIENNTVAVLKETVGHLQAVIKNTEGLVRTSARGGRPRYDVAHFILLNMCVAFFRFDPKRRKLTPNPDGAFGKFSEAFVILLGLSTEWIARQLPRAILAWEKRQHLVNRHPSVTLAQDGEDGSRRRQAKSTKSRTSTSD